MRSFLVRLFLFVLLTIIGIYGDTSTETSQIEKEFLEFDMNSDGFIDAQEIRIVRASVTLQELHQFFWEIDTDNSGTISLAEYSHFVITNAHAQHSNGSQHS